MKLILDDAEAFSELFKGNPNAYGLYTPPKTKSTKGKKVEGDCKTVTKPINQTHYLKHLHGEMSLGVAPINHEGYSWFGVIDIDDYDINVKKYLDLIDKMGLPLSVFRSKSGGLHLYLFLLKITRSSNLIKCLNNIRRLFGLPEDTEIFPKQAMLATGKAGNWINLPYHNCKKTDRYLFDHDGEPVEFSKAIEICKNRRTSISKVNSHISSLPLAKAPPCIQSIFLAGGADEGNRNVFLFNCAVYLKARFEKDYAEHLHKLNSLTDNPIEYVELDRTIVASHNKGDYNYQCSDNYLKLYCDKQVCSNRQFGRDSKNISNITFGILTQVKCDVPYYKWKINDKELIFYSEAEIINQTKFRELCMRELHTLIMPLKLSAWFNIVNRALENLELEEVAPEDDISEYNLWLTKLGDFLGQRQAIRKSQVDDGLVWFATEKDGLLFFKAASFLEYITRVRQFGKYNYSQHRNLLQKIGAVPARLRDENNKQLRVYKLDIEELQLKGYFSNVVYKKMQLEDLKEFNYRDKEKF